ncbi:Hypothetical predicted protein, partial [Olea europaea subsp. europaea]
TPPSKVTPTNRSSPNKRPSEHGRAAPQTVTSGGRGDCGDSNNSKKSSLNCREDGRPTIAVNNL